jgi:divalent metal cation (Fe/Co/Zn/Cd) transporter
MKKLFSQSDKQHNGFVLLFALVVSAIIFFIGAGIFSISFKELMVSSISKESQKSIFAADSGVECG